MMTNGLKYVSSYASMIAGACLILGHTLNLGGNEEFGTVTGSTLVFTAHLLLVFSFIGIYVAQGLKNGILGALGMVLGVFGSVATTAVVYVEIAGASGVRVDDVTASGVPSIIHSVLPLLFVIGLVLVASSMIRGKIFAPASGYLLITGTIVFVAASFAGGLQQWMEVLGAVLTGLGFIQVGLNLFADQRRKKVPGFERVSV